MLKVSWISLIAISIFWTTWTIGLPVGTIGGGSKVMRTMRNLLISLNGTKTNCPKKLMRLCRREKNFTDVLQEALILTVENCHEQFKYTRWNCTLNKRLFNDVTRETSIVTSIFAASLTHAFARSCGENKLSKCDSGRTKTNEISRASYLYKNHSSAWTDKKLKLRGPSDNVKFGRQMARKILIGGNQRSSKKRGMMNNFKDIVSWHNIEIGLMTVGKSKDDCQCQGFSSSCTIKICRRLLNDFKESAKNIRDRYPKALLIRDESDEAKYLKFRISKKHRRRLPLNYHGEKINQLQLYYIKPSPNFCKDTHDRKCFNEINCSTLCCGRGFKTNEIQTPSKCNCGKKNKCKTCSTLMKIHTCK
ncbi:protein Wnt-4-like [Athalia rosae]|uniref:protein Wnt-4-like n=1 Tax=Athalia rosae TaxID=37344 RepID=UPI002033223E|nr:protein Wnt-4-like [Athalia rosae]